MHFILALVAALIGGLLEGPSGFFFTGLVAFAVALMWEQRRELQALRRRVDALDGQARSATAPPRPALADGREATPRPKSAAPEEPSAAAAAEARPALAPRHPGAPAEETPGRPMQPPELERLIGVAVARIKHFFTTGNPVVRIGVVVLFFGIAFLLRYAWERELLPVEFRLAAVALMGIALTTIGWRLRRRSDTYGLVLQGAGIGILYLTIFSAARLYDLLPLTGAFALLAGLTVGAAILAVVQNAQALAIFAMSGGFLAPVLVSTGAGSHVALFSYYALLNTGIVAMAWYRHWRWLNWVGFLFTFVIGTAWGYRYYRPELFASTEPFLILFFLYYVGVSVLFARRHGVKLRSLVDGTLVFGTPMVAFALQWGLVRDLPFGMAYSALAAALLYIGLALWLRNNRAFGTLLGQSFLALGVVFATLAIPFAFDNQRWTAATWALEGAGLLWVGLRQRQLLPRLFGVALQVGAAAAFVSELGVAEAMPFMRNSRFLGALLLGLGGGFSAYLLARHRDEVRTFEAPVRWLLLFWGLTWWLSAFISELNGFQPASYGPYEPNNVAENLFMLLAALSFAALTALARWQRWREAIAAGYLLLPIAAITLLGLDQDWRSAFPLNDLGWAAWPVTLMALYQHLHEADQWPKLAPHWHAGCWWFAAVFVAWACAAAPPESVSAASVWRVVFWALVPLAFILGLLAWHSVAAAGTPSSRPGRYRPPRWPITAYPPSYVGWGAGAMLAAVGVWLVATGLQAFPPHPLPYLVLTNPLELTQLAVLLVALHWTRSQDPAWRQPALAAIGAVAFIWVNLTAARAVHFYAGVPYPLDSIVRSDALQTTISILWSSIALLLMGLGTRRGWRRGWLVGAVLLGVVLLKLFTLDLSNLALVARIVSFISVGLLMLLIGYFAPLPPATREENT